MSRSISILLIIFVSFTVFGQKQKPLFYYDVDDTQIKKSIFLKKYRDREDDISYLSLTFENDTCFVHKLVKRKNYGKLSKKDFNLLITYLNDSYYQPNSKFTIIQYHPGFDKCNNGRLYFKGINSSYTNSYLKKLKKRLSFNNYRIYKKDSTLNYSDLKRFMWHFDTDNLIQKLFFKYHYPCGSFVIINNENRKFTSIFGEYGASTVEEIALEMSNKS